VTRVRVRALFRSHMPVPTRVRRLALYLAVTASAVTTAAVTAQQPLPRPQAAVVPEAITVGDVFHAAIRIELPAGAAVLAPDSLRLPPDLELTGRRELRTDTVDGTPRVTVIYPLTAWRPGSYDIEPVMLRLVSDGADAPLTAQLPSFSVRSVLPSDTAGLEARGAKDVLGANRVWWPILLALLVAAALAVALWYWWRRRQAPAAAAAEPEPVVIPREAALAALDALRREGLLERGEVRLYYDRLTETLRHFAATLDPAWGVDLTTAEVAARMRAAGFSDGLELVRILGAADLVKFARAKTTQDAASRYLDVARSWVERVEPPGRGAGSDERRAA
jgi:hypothetical protein